MQAPEPFPADSPGTHYQEDGLEAAELGLEPGTPLGDANFPSSILNPGPNTPQIIKGFLCH